MDGTAEPGAAGALKDAILIAGPTASGKSSLALDVARRTGGTIVNADSMQVYSVLCVLTARPGASDMEAVPHRLYGHVHPSRTYSTGHWAREVAALAEAGEPAAGPTIFVGGTGLYFRALTEGLSPMPEVPAAVRARWRRRLKRDGAEALHQVLGREDPAAARGMDASDGQRIVRALEVLDASGRPISEWRAERTRPLVDTATARLVVLEVERALLHERIDTRFERMIEAGALEEVEALTRLGLDPAIPAMKAIGVRELAAGARLADAVTVAKTATRRYAKRQVTWFRHQLGPQWRRISVSPADATSGLARDVLSSVFDANR